MSGLREKMIEVAAEVPTMCGTYRLGSEDAEAIVAALLAIPAVAEGLKLEAAASRTKEGTGQ